MTANLTIPHTGFEQSPNSPHSIELVGVRKSFGSGNILDGIDLTFVHNAITTVLGPSGTGKSVLLKHIVGLLEPDEGEVRVFGSDIWGVSEHERYELRKRFGVLFQDGALFGSMNIYDNVAFPLRKHTNLSEVEIRDIVMDKIEQPRGLIRYSTDRAMAEGLGAKEIRKRVMRPRVLLYTGGLLLLVYALNRGADHGWTSPSTLLLFGVAGLLLAAFVGVEGRSQAPLVPAAAVWFAAGTTLSMPRP